MANSKRPDKNRPSRQRYHAEGHRKKNKIRRIAKNNGDKALSKWLSSKAADRT